MLIVLFDPTNASCQRFWRINEDLPCRRWNVQHPLIKRRLQRSPRAHAVQSLPTVIDVDATGQVAFYTHEQAFIHAQAVKDQLFRPVSVPQGAGQRLSSLRSQDRQASVDMEVLSVPEEQPAQQPSDATTAGEQQIPDKMTTQADIDEALKRKPKDATASEIAAQMRKARDEFESSLPPPRTQHHPQPPTSAPIEGAGGSRRSPTMNMGEIMGGGPGMHPPDPPGLGMEPGQ